jgi:hypothetical protein
MDPRLRASDADREQAVAALRTHVADGRITVEEFSDRAAAAYDARTLGDLAAIASDLPPTEPLRLNDGGEGRRRNRPAWQIAGIAASTAIGVWLFAWLTTAAAVAAPMAGGLCH